MHKRSLTFIPTQRKVREPGSGVNVFHIPGETVRRQLDAIVIIGTTRRRKPLGRNRIENGRTAMIICRPVAGKPFDCPEGARFTQPRATPWGHWPGHNRHRRPNGPILHFGPNNRHQQILALLAELRSPIGSCRRHIAFPRRTRQPTKTQLRLRCEVPYRFSSHAPSGRNSRKPTAPGVCVPLPFASGSRWLPAICCRCYFN